MKNNIDFIDRRYKRNIENLSDSSNVIDNAIYSFYEIIGSSSIAIILGEPASGKTAQLKKYKEDNQSNSTFIELIDIDEAKDISLNIEVVLFDSIDEALLGFENSDKKVKNRLVNYIDKCKTLNPKVKCIISCRYLEWKSVYEEAIKQIDDDIKIYNILELSKNDIDLLLEKQQIDKNVFWEYIENNYLHELLTNVMMVVKLIEDFESYKNKSFKYQEIYLKIIDEHLTAKTDNQRKENILKLSREEMLGITSSLALYMMLNKHPSISIENIDLLAGELYKINGTQTTGEKLKLVLDTALFIGTAKNTKFFHKSIQEFLAAYFVNQKQMDVEFVKKLFAYEHSFYEEFEELTIYLTNIEPSYFRYLVDFDPFIFRRHPYLNQHEQKQLLISMLNTLQSNRHKAWGKWEYLRDSTLIKFDKLDEIASIVKEHVDTKSAKLELIIYLVSILECRYSKDLEDILFEVLEHKKSDREECLEIVSNIRVDNYFFTSRLFDFLVKNDFIGSERDNLLVHYFKTLYKKRDFNELIILLKNISRFYLDLVIFDIEPNDVLTLFEKFEKTHTYQNRFADDENISFVVWSLFKHYSHYNDPNILKRVFEFAKISHIHFGIINSGYGYENDKKKYELDFSTIKEDFWNYYFECAKDWDDRHHALETLIAFYDILKDDLFEVVSIYNVDDNLEQYNALRRYIVGAEEYLLLFDSYKTYFEELKKNYENMMAKHQRKDRKIDREIAQREEQRKRAYQQAISSLSTLGDICNIYFMGDYFSDENEKLTNRLKTDLGDSKYVQFLELIKSEFQKDETYKEIKKQIFSNTAYYVTYYFDYIFSETSNTDALALISGKDSFEKLFWHAFAKWKISEDYFVEIARNYKNKFIELALDVLKLSLQQSTNKNIKIDWYFLEAFKKLGIFNIENLSMLIHKSKETLDSHYQTLSLEGKEYLLQVIKLDKNNLTFIKEIMLKDRRNYRVYLSFLFRLDANYAFKCFLEYFYPKGSERLSITPIGKKCYAKTPYKIGRFDNVFISPNFLSSFKSLASSILEVCGRRMNIDLSLIETLDDLYIEFILTKYFLFFKTYHSPRGSYSPDIYDNLNDLISKIFQTLGENSKRITLLEKLALSQNELLRERSRYQLELAHNNLFKNRDLGATNYQKIINEYSPNSKRFFDYEKLKNDLVFIASQLTESRHPIFNETEDLINDRFKQMLTARYYYLRDQSRGGESESGKSVGERDLVIFDKETRITEAVIEAFCLNSLDTAAIDGHYQKLLHKYDTLGNQTNYILVYSKAKDFSQLWDKYKKHFEDFSEQDSQKDFIKIGSTKDDRVCHIFINFYSEQPANKETA